MLITIKVWHKQSDELICWFTGYRNEADRFTKRMRHLDRITYVTTHDYRSNANV